MKPMFPLNPRRNQMSRNTSPDYSAGRRKSRVIALTAGISMLLAATVAESLAQTTVRAWRPSAPYRGWYSFQGYADGPEMYTHATMTLGGGPDARFLETIGKSGMSWGYGTQIGWNAASTTWENYCGPYRNRAADSNYSYNFVTAGTALDEWLYRSDFPEVYQRIADGLKAGKQANPDAFVPIWLIDAVRPELHEIGKQGYGDLLIVEGYTHTVTQGLGVSWEQGTARQEELDERGLGRKTIFGMGHITDQPGWNGNMWTEELLRLRMEDIRLRYPHSPGIAFFGGGIGTIEAYKPLATLIDKLSKEYWPELPIRNGIYGLTPQNATRTRMDAANSGTANGTQVLIYSGKSSFTSLNQKWRFTHLGDNVYRIQPSYSSNVSLDVTSASNSNGTLVQLYTNNNTNAQKWKFVAVEGGYMLSPLCAPGKYLRASSTSNGTQLQIWSDLNEAGQVWAVNPEVSSADPVQYVYQSESAVLGGNAQVDSGAWVGSTGGGAVKTNSSGSVTWTGVNGGTGGTKTLIIRYTVADYARTANLTVNGVTTQVTFPTTASWRTYEKFRIQQNLNAGTNNTIAISAGVNPSPTIDKVTIADASVMNEDWERPTAPSGLQVGQVTGSTVSLSWTAATDNVGVTGYEVYRDGLKVGTATGTSFTDTGLSGITAYTYYVKAIDAAWHMSPITSKVTVTTLPESGVVYGLEPQNAPGKRLDVSGPSSADGTNVVIYSSTSGSNQKWKVLDQGNGVFEIEPQNAIGKRLDVNASSASDSANVNIWTDVSGASQRWTILPVGDGWFELEPTHAPGKRLDVKGAYTANGTNVQIYTDNNTTAQRWRFVP